MLMNAGKTRFIAPVAAVILLLLFSFSDGKKGRPKGVKTIVIDAGHGGKDPGCNGDIQKEKDVALGIALKLGELIEKNLPDVKVVYTRKTDVFVELEERAQIANRNNADLFISIHCNAASTYAITKDKNGKVHYKTFKDKKGKVHKVEVHNPRPFGSATYVMGINNEKGKLNTAKRENASMLLEENYQKTYNGFDPESDEAYIVMSLWTGAFVGQSADLASKIQDEYVKKAGRVDKGVQRQSIWVLWRTAMPSILTEVGFLTNPEEEKFLGSEKGQKYMASALFRAVRSYKDEAEGNNKKYDDETEKLEPLVNENLSKGNKNDEPQDSAQVVESANEELYNGFIKEADDFFKVKKYEEALPKYEKCNELKPEEKYPLYKIEECKKKIAEQKSGASAEDAKKKEEEKKYNALILSGDKLFSQKKWNAAIAQYQLALELKPEQVYPAEKIKECEQNDEDERKRVKEKEAQDKLMAEQKKADEEKKHKEDSVKTKPKDILTVYKEKTPKKDTVKTTKSNPVKAADMKSGISFRVQFGMSETEPDLSSSKYKDVETIWSYKVGNVYKLTSGDFAEPEAVVKHQGKMREMGYKDAFAVAFKDNKRIDFKEAVKLIQK